MKKILGLSIAALLVMGLVGGGTWAYFSDPETTAGNALTAGTLDLSLSDGTAGAVFAVSNKAPGDNSTVNYVTLANGGSLAGELDIAFSAITDNESIGATEYESDSIGGGGIGELGGQAQMAAFLDIDANGWDTGDIGLNPAGGTYAYSAGEADWMYATITTWGSKSWNAIVASMTGPYRFYAPWKIPVTTGNTIQGDSVGFTVTFTLEQAGVD